MARQSASAVAESVKAEETDEIRCVGRMDRVPQGEFSSDLPLLLAEVAGSLARMSRWRTKL